MIFQHPVAQHLHNVIRILLWIKTHFQNTFKTCRMHGANHFLHFRGGRSSSRVAGLGCKIIAAAISPVVDPRQFFFFFLIFLLLHQLIPFHRLWCPALKVHPGLLVSGWHQLLKLIRRHQFHGRNTEILQIRNLFRDRRECSFFLSGHTAVLCKASDMELIKHHIRSRYLQTVITFPVKHGKIKAAAHLIIHIPPAVVGPFFPANDPLRVRIDHYLFVDHIIIIIVFCVQPLNADRTHCSDTKFLRHRNIPVRTAHVLLFSFFIEPDRTIVILFPLKCKTDPVRKSACSESVVISFSYLFCHLFFSAFFVCLYGKQYR